MTLSFMGINLYAVLAAGVAGWLFGAVWYGVLGKQWMAALETTPEALKRTGFAAAAPFLLSFVLELFMAMMLAGILLHGGWFNLRAGIIAGAVLWLGFVLPTMWINHAYEFRKPMLTVIDGLHFLGVLMIQGAILGAFGRG